MSGRGAALCLIVVLTLAFIGSRFTLPSNRSQNGSAATEQVTCHIQPIEYRYQGADLILTGSVFAVIPNNDSTADVLITPDKVYKGVVPETGVALAARPAAMGGALTLSNDLHFTSNDPPYLLVLAARADGRYHTSRCDGSRLLGERLFDHELEALENPNI